MVVVVSIMVPTAHRATDMPLSRVPIQIRDMETTTVDSLHTVTVVTAISPITTSLSTIAATNPVTKAMVFSKVDCNSTLDGIISVPEGITNPTVVKSRANLPD